MAVLEVRNLRVRFDAHDRVVQAVDEVSFRLERGETLGLVGESGSGKSVSCLALLGLIPQPPGVVESGEAWFEDQNLLALAERDLRKIRGRKISMVFQDPMTSLNPYLTVGRQLTEVLEAHGLATVREAHKKSVKILGEVGLSQPERRMDQYPHELSGGMRQRVVIAMAMIAEPQVLFADEPTTALDVTVQAQILELMGSLQKRRGTAIVLITHDLGVVAGMADRVHVMYAGRLVETARTRELFSRPMHPYSLGLLKSVPNLQGDPKKPLLSIPGQPPDPSARHNGCAFVSRCDVVGERCKAERPALETLPKELFQAAKQDDPLFLGGRRSACFELEKQLAASKTHIADRADRDVALSASLENKARGRRR